MHPVRFAVTLAAATCALIAPQAANAETIVNEGGGTILIGDNQTGFPYPGVIDIEGGDGDILDVNVRMTLAHDHPDDLDIAIVAPNGQARILMADACGSEDFAGRTLTFDGDAATALPDAGICSAGGTYRPASYGTATWPAPGPTTSSTDLETLANSDPNGRWRLFALDDAAGQFGSINNWALTITTATGEVVIPAGPATSGIASPYPMTKNIPTPDGEVITDVNLDINDFSHINPDDVDLLLQGPGGDTVMAMSDACGADDIHGFFWNFDDEGLAPFTDQVRDGCFPNVIKPSQFGEVENMPAPAPAGPYGSAMSVFDGRQGGDWRIWAADDTSLNTGYINDWALTMSTRPAADVGFAAPTAATAEGQTATLTVSRSGPADLGPATVSVDLNHSGTTPADLGAGTPTQLQFARGETSKTIEIPINPDLEGEGAEDLIVQLSNPVDDARLTDATSFAVVTIAPSPPDNRFTLGKAVKQPNGTAKIPVTIPNPGTLSFDDSGPKDLLKAKETDVAAAGETMLTLKPAKKAKRKLRKGKKVKLTAEITYTPYDGTPNTATAPVKLKKKD